MGLKQRIKRLERAQEPQGEGYALCSPAGDDLTDAEVITVPTANREGLARLADGTERAVILKAKAAFVFADDKFTEKLWWIRQDWPIFLMPPGITEEDL